MIKKLQDNTNKLQTLINLLSVLYSKEDGSNNHLITQVEIDISNLLKNDIGELLLVNLKSIPTGKDWNFDRWMDYIKNNKIVFTD